MNTRVDETNTKARMIHIRLPEDLHKKVRIRAAESDKTIQDWVVQVITRNIERENSKKTD
jgi:plasmid stability protein